MKATLKFCGEQINRLDGLTGFASMGEDGFRERAEALMDAAGTEELADAAVTALLRDPTRGSNENTNRLPSAGELCWWVDQVRQSRRDGAASANSTGGGCGRCQDGWVFVVRRIIPPGRTAPEDFTFAGKCPKCNSPSWYGAAS